MKLTLKLKWVVALILSHLFVAFIGFSGGIYTLPILTATPSASNDSVAKVAGSSLYQTEFIKELQDSDLLHWGKAKIYIGKGTIAWQGELAPGPAYRLYLSKTFIETEAEFLRLKSDLVPVGEVTSFGNYRLTLPANINVSEYSSVIIWCESFSQFITAAQYQQLKP